MKAALVGCLLLLSSSCFRARPSEGGGQGVPPERPGGPVHVRLPAGYRIEAVARNLTFPSGVAFDDAGTPFVIEAGYSYGEKFVTPRLLRVDRDGVHVVATGSNGPWNGVDHAHGSFFVAEGGEKDGGRILRIEPDGQTRALIDHLPSFGDHHTDGPVVHEGFVYFGQGTATNSGVVGEDSAQFGWLARKPDFHDVPCRDVTLAGVNFESKDRDGQKVTTGAFLPLGQKSEKGQVIKGALPCNGAVMRIRIDGGPPELVAWGFRNPFGLAFSPDGHLYVTDNGFDVRGSRPVWGAADLLWEVQTDTWYGWPDFVGGEPIDKKRFAVPGKSPPSALLANAPSTPPLPRAWFGVHSSSNGLDFSRNATFGHQGQAFVAQFGDMAPAAGKVLGPVGFKVVRVDPHDGVITDFAVNEGDENGPASKLGRQGLERPVACRFEPKGLALYVVDFGVMSFGEKGPMPKEGTGVLWKITREGAS